MAFLVVLCCVRAHKTKRWRWFTEMHWLSLMKRARLNERDLDREEAEEST